MPKSSHFTGDLGPILPVTKRKAETVTTDMLERGVAIRTEYGYNDTPDHNNLKCIDFMVTNSRPSGRKAGDAIAAYLIANAERLGVYLIIWNRRIWRSYSHSDRFGYHAPGTWAVYYGTSNPHTDHLHVQFTADPIKGNGHHAAPNVVHRDAKKESDLGTITVYAGKHQGKHPDIPAVSVDQINKCREHKWFSRHVWYLQEWLRLCGYRGHGTGVWDRATQRQYNKFRRAHGYEGDDAKGTVGISSLTDLRRRAQHYAEYSRKPVSE